MSAKLANKAMFMCVILHGKVILWWYHTISMVSGSPKMSKFTLAGETHDSRKAGYSRVVRHIEGPSVRSLGLRITIINK